MPAARDPQPDIMKYRRQRVDLRSFLATEVPLHDLSPDLRRRVRHAIAEGEGLCDVGAEVARVLLGRGILRRAGVLRDGNERIPVYCVGASPRVFDLRALLGEDEAAPAQSLGAALGPPPASATPAEGPAPVPGPADLPSSAGTRVPPGTAAPNGLARASLEAIRRTLRRDWVSYGMEASLEAVLDEMADRLGDPSLRLVLWSERLRLSLGSGPRWQMLHQGDRESLALERGLLGAGIGGALHEGRRWRPLHVDGSLVGALGLATDTSSALPAEAVQTVEELLLAFLRSQQRVYTDPLTGLNNRGFFEHQIGVELERASRSDQTLALLFVDLDHFKRINDEHGHDAGDAVLQHVARLMQSHLRRIDYVFRWGGEEFAMLLPGTASEEALQTAERVREVIAASPVILPSGESIRVTVSIGVAVAPMHARGGERELLRHADQALYRAKQEGRNRVRVSGGLLDER